MGDSDPAEGLNAAAASATLGDSRVNNLELTRRKAASKTRVHVRILLNGKEVCQTASKNLISGDDFVVHIGQIFPVQIIQLPGVVTKYDFVKFVTPLMVP